MDGLHVLHATSASAGIVVSSARRKGVLAEGGYGRLKVCGIGFLRMRRRSL